MTVMQHPAWRWPARGAAAAAVSLALAWGAQAQVIQIEPLSSAPENDSASEAPVLEDRLLELDPPDVIAEERGRLLPSGDLSGQSDAAAARPELLPIRLATPRVGDPGTPRLTGEVARERFVLFLPGPAGAAQMQLAHRSGIDVLPDLSQLEVMLNGIPVGTVRPDNFDAFGFSRFEIPEGVLQPGQNLVEIVARHSHRIACGPEAAFALWSEIETASSGVIVSSEALTPGPQAFLAAFSAQVARGDPIVIRRPDPSAPLDEAAPFIARVVAALGGTPPAIRSVPYWTVEEGSPDLVRITALEPGMDPDAPRFVRGGDGAIVLVVERGGDYGAVSSMLMSAVGAVPAREVPQLILGEARPLGELDAPALSGEGRYSLLPVQFRLPWDWLLLASQRARLDLDYRFAPGLPEGALMLVKVNGTTVRLLPLDREGGTELPTLPVRFQAALLRPGLNRLDFEIMVPGDPPDAACPPIEGAIVDIAPESRLFVPASPSMALPSIDRSLGRMAGGSIRVTEAAARQVPPGLVPQIASGLGVGPSPAAQGGTLTIATPADLERLRAPLMREAAAPLAAALGAGGRVVDMEAAAAPVAGPGPLSPSRLIGWVTDLPARLIAAEQRLVFGDSPDLGAWLDGRSAAAALLQPDPAAEDDLWLVIAPDARISEVVRALAASRMSADGPRGQAALYSLQTGWQSWTAPDLPLRLNEPLRAPNLRVVTGNYASHMPLGFVLSFMSFTLISALVAICFLLVTRRRRP